MIMYGDEYKYSKSGKIVKEKEDKSDICKDKSQKVKRFVPSLEKTNENKKRTFIPSLTPELKQKRTNFTPSMELPKEPTQKRFTPTLTTDTNKKRRNFTPSLEMTEKEKRDFIPDFNLKDPKKHFKFNKNYEVQKIKDYIKKIEWNDIVKDWNIKYPKNQHSNYEIQLNPKQDCSRINPLYKHKIWLEIVYTNKKLNLTDQLISEVCGVHLVTIQNWRKKHGIPAKNWMNGSWIDDRGYIKLYMPHGYLHPEIVPQKGRNVRFEHEIVMENYLSKNPELEWSKKYLIDGKYLKIECNVHHINFKKSDNRLRNLWLYENTKSHKKAEKSLNECFRDLIKLNQIGFEDGKYYLNTNFDCRKLSSSEINELLKPVSINPYKDINLVKEEIKKINWKEISDNWIVKIRENQSSEKEFSLDPYSDCSDENPLYLHKQWVERLVQDENFNLTQRRLAKLCGVDRGIIYYWSKVKHNIDIENKERGFGKRQHSDGRIWMRVPKGFENPTAKNNNGWMYEHRYVIEQYLTEHPELQWSKKYLIDGKYLKPECIVHHINFDSMDNRLENLWICENRNEHLLIESSLLSLVDELLKTHFIVFRDGEYHLKL